ncbi:MAG: hypothetical protein J6J36_08075 [Clostridia bacterium]|nr:hypothetical protein [Clostridia bacterium]MBP3708530.1 hypothetical protein [Clostridia bacterium]
MLNKFIRDLTNAGACPTLISNILFKVNKDEGEIKNQIEVIVNNFECNECNACEL